jgi:hypothetical protein
MTRTLLLCLPLLLSADALQAQAIYRCQTYDGATAYQSQPCPDGSSQERLDDGIEAGAGNPVRQDERFIGCRSIESFGEWAAPDRNARGVAELLAAEECQWFGRNDPLQMLQTDLEGGLVEFRRSGSEERFFTSGEALKR